ncbi:MAG: FAD:protein FMN transferase [Muribaculaceae bacterium]|nr:FAD:protein FMN transferase [Muribaculaceae bacterium]MDE6792944.1 FAD:protein FMN transferase [Muribaculaceae bacterium]
MMKKKTHRLFSLVWILLLTATGCSRPSGYVRTSGMIWNTSYHITFSGDPSLADSVMRVLNEVGGSLNVFDSTSLVSRVNRLPESEVDSHFIRVYEESRKINEASGGMFDPTLSPLITAWGFGKGHKITPDTAAIDSVLKFVGIKKTFLDKGRIIKNDSRTQFNFSAIAKGYGCDMVAEMLERNGVRDYLVEIGGEIASGGNAPGGRRWRISIDSPSENNINSKESGAVIEIGNDGIATSGNYRNFHTEGGKNLGHTISPLSGRPVKTDILSATVIAPTCMEADAVATACMATGMEGAISILKRLNLDGMLIREDSTVWHSEGFRKRLISAESSEPGRRGRN